MRRLRLTVEQALQLVAVDGLFFEQHVHDTIHQFTVLGQQTHRGIHAGIHDVADFHINLGGDLFGIVALLVEVAAQENRPAALAQLQRPQVGAHAELAYHAARRVRHFFQVVLRARPHFVVNDLFRSATAQRRRHVVNHLRAAHQELVLGGQSQHVAQRHAARQNRDFVRRLDVRQQLAEQRVSDLVISDDRFFLVLNNAAFTLRPGYHALDRFVELGVGKLLLVAPRRQQSGLVDQVGQVGAAEARRALAQNI